MRARSVLTDLSNHPRRHPGGWWTNNFGRIVFLTGDGAFRGPLCERTSAAKMGLVGMRALRR